MKKIFFFNEQYYKKLDFYIQELESAKNKYFKLLKVEDNDKEVEEEHLENHINNILVNEDEKKELKELYRKVCRLCHPDKVGENKKEEAHQLFIELNLAYKEQDIRQIYRIYEQLKNDQELITDKFSLDKLEILNRAINRTQYNIKNSLDELFKLKNSYAGEMLLLAGNSSEDWNTYFDAERKVFETQIQEIYLNINFISMMKA